MHGNRGKCSGAEVDVFGKWRKRLCYTQKAGVCKGIKRQFQRKLRQKARLELQKI